MCLSLAGLLIHAELHPVTKSLYFWWASPVCIVSLLVLPVLFIRPRTVAWGYGLNLFIIALGTIGMGYFSLLNFEPPVTLWQLGVRSTLPAIIILWLKLPLAYFILLQMRLITMDGR